MNYDFSYQNHHKLQPRNPQYPIPTNQNINDIDQRHYNHQCNLQEFINDFHENSRENQGKSMINSPIFQRKRTFSEISAKKLNDFRPISSENKQNYCNFQGVGEISDFNSNGNYQKNTRNYDTIIVPTHAEAKNLSFIERRNIYNKKDENSKINKNAYLKKYHNSFNLQYDENMRKTMINSHKNPYLGDLFIGFLGQKENFDEKTINMEKFAKNIEENQMKFSRNERNPMNTHEFTGKDSQKIKNTGFYDSNQKKNMKKTVNLANLPLILQDFVVLMEYDKEIERVKSLLKSNGQLKLWILYKIMGKPANSIIDIHDFTRLMQFLKFEVQEGNLVDLFKRFSKTDSIKLK